jgi:sec-independent protein translocase protein TatC
MLASSRRPVILFIFIASAILTPTTDLVVQSLLAVPACILYEITIQVLRLMRL